jgi:hypothetical protein
MVFVEGDNYRQLRRPGDDPAQFRSVVRPAQVPAAPDSVVHQYRAENFTTSTWPDSEQSADISVNGLTASTLNGEPSVSGDGVDDFGEDGDLAPFGANADTDFAIELVLQTTDRGNCLGTADSTSDMALGVRTGDPFDSVPDRLSFTLRSAAASSNFISVSSGTTVTDGTARHIIINKTGNTGSDIEIILNGSADTVQINRDTFDPTNTRNFQFPIRYFASNFQTNVAGPIDAEIPLIRLYNDSLSGQQQQNLFDAQPYV